MKKNIKLKDLARELGLTSRALIERCRAEGILVQNSISKLSPQQERQVRGWFEKSGERDAGGRAEVESSPTSIQRHAE